MRRSEAVTVCALGGGDKVFQQIFLQSQPPDRDTLAVHPRRLCELSGGGGGQLWRCVEVDMVGSEGMHMRRRKRLVCVRKLSSLPLSLSLSLRLASLSLSSLSPPISRSSLRENRENGKRERLRSREDKTHQEETEVVRACEEEEAMGYRVVEYLGVELRGLSEEEGALALEAEVVEEDSQFCVQEYLLLREE